MDWRNKELLDLKSFTQNVETEVTMLLQSLQWDRKRLLEGTSTATCQYDANHKMPEDNLEIHESKCILRSLGYAETDELLPDPPDDEAHTLVKFSDNEIQQIINKASKADPRFKKGVSHQPRSLARLQLVYTADERRALHDAVVAAVPSCHDLGDLALASSNEGTRQGAVTKSRVEILAELRDMKRRRTKYRVAAKTKNYSDVLRDVIKAQMESYSEAVSNTPTVKTEENVKHNQNKNVVYDIHKSRNYSSWKYDSVMSRDKSEERRRLVVRESSAATKSTYDVHPEESRHREERKRKETFNKTHEHRHSRSDARERHENLREKKIREEDKHRERSREKYKSRSEHSSTRHDNSGRHRNRCEEENGHKLVGRDKLEKIAKRKDYEYDDRRSESRHYKEKYIKVKVEADDQNMSSTSSFSKHLHKSESKKHRRSRSGDSRRGDRKRKQTEEYESSGHRHVLYQRYYDVEVKKEES